MQSQSAGEFIPRQGQQLHLVSVASGLLLQWRRPGETTCGLVMICSVAWGSTAGRTAPVGLAHFLSLVL